VVLLAVVLSLKLPPCGGNCRLLLLLLSLAVMMLPIWQIWNAATLSGANVTSPPAGEDEEGSFAVDEKVQQPLAEMCWEPPLRHNGEGRGGEGQGLAGAVDTDIARPVKKSKSDNELTGLNANSSLASPVPQRRRRLRRVRPASVKAERPVASAAQQKSPEGGSRCNPPPRTLSANAVLSHDNSLPVQEKVSKGPAKTVAEYKPAGEIRYIVQGIASGAAGVLRDPYLGARQSGPKGFAYGIVKGSAGLVGRPLRGLFRAGQNVYYGMTAASRRSGANLMSNGSFRRNPSKKDICNSVGASGDEIGAAAAPGPRKSFSSHPVVDLGEVNFVGQLSVSRGIVVGTLTCPIVLAAMILARYRIGDTSGALYLVPFLECAIASSLHMWGVELRWPFHWTGGTIFRRAVGLGLSYFFASHPLLCAWAVTIADALMHLLEMQWGRQTGFQFLSLRRGEAHILVQAVSLWTLDAFAVLPSRESSTGIFPVPPLRSEEMLVAQSGLLGLLLIGIILVAIQNVFGNGERPVRFEVLGAVVIACLALVYWWMYILLGSIKDPISWIAGEVAGGRWRMCLCCYWGLLLLSALPLIPWLKQNAQLHKVMARKLFHILAVLLFLPAGAADPIFLRLALAVALGILGLLEILCLIKMPGICGPLRGYYAAFTDTRDGGSLVVTHLYLVLGCLLPLWFSPSILTHSYDCALSLCGIVCLGVGDAVGAVVGTQYGTIRWPSSRRTIEGSAAMFFATIVLLGVVNDLCSASSGKVILPLVAPVAIMAIFEAVTTQVDNLLLPCYAFASLIAFR
jgi:dolichol kinase